MILKQSFIFGLLSLCSAAAGADPLPCDLLEISKFVGEARALVAAPKHLRVHRALRDTVEQNMSIIEAEQDARGMGPRGGDVDASRFIWMRDFYSLWGFDPGRIGAEPILVNYVNPFSSRGRPEGSINHYIGFKSPNAPQDATAISLSGKTQFAVQRNFPGILEGGNVQWTNHRSEPYIFTSEKTIDQNRFISSSTYQNLRAQVATRVTGTGNSPERWINDFYTYLKEINFKLPATEQSRVEILGNLSKATGVPSDRIIVTPWMPGETTGHVDVWLGTLPGNLVVVPYIPERLITRLGYEHERNFSNGINTWLNQRVNEISLLPGIKVVRLPMLPPKNLVASAQSELGYDALILSSANFVIVGRKALMPEHRKWINELPAEERQLLREEIGRVFKSAGYETEFVGADKLLDKKGGLHCASIDYPDFFIPELSQ